jgi:hypothetical protein
MDVRTRVTDLLAPTSKIVVALARQRLESDRRHTVRVLGDITKRM